MPVTIIPSFIAYCYITGITPGPANLCSLSAGIRYGKKIALRQWRGLFVGFSTISLLSVLATYFLGSVLNRYVRVLSWVGAAYILWLAWHILRSSNIETQDGADLPCFRTGMLVQMTNVKVMVSCVTALASFVLPYNTSFFALLAAGLFLPFTGPVANLVWLYAGASLQKLFSDHRKAVDRVMAVSLALCAVSIVMPH
ncbi:MAG: LysE family transporter [Lachnospiraceae bacterium]|nr:LysE family transporter [Lachnospiraceae bacterium]